MQIRLRILLMFLEWIFGDNNKYRCSDAWYEVFAKPMASSVLGIGSNPPSFQFLFERQLLFISSFFSCEELPIWNTPASPASLPFPPPCLNPDPNVKEPTNLMWSYPATCVYSAEGCQMPAIPDTIYTISLAKPDNVHRISSNYCGLLPYGRISSSILPRSRKAE